MDLFETLINSYLNPEFPEHQELRDPQLKKAISEVQDKIFKDVISMQLALEKVSEENLQKKLSVMIRDKFNQYEVSTDVGKELTFDQEKVHLVKIFDMQQKLTNMSKIEFERLTGSDD
jgi:hypothetical protein